MRRNARRNALALLVLLVGVPALVAGAPACARGAPLEGELVEGKQGVLLLRTGSGTELVAADADTTLLGITSLDALLPGERVRVRWSSSLANVKLAETIEADAAWAVQDPALALDPVSAAAILVPTDGSPPAAVAVDVRPGDRFEAGHLPGARRLDAKGPAALARLVPDKGARLVLYGEGPRDAAPLAALREARAQGYGNAQVLGSGLAGWKAAQLPVGIEPAALARALAAGQRFVIVDLRPPDRARQGTVPGAVSIPLAGMQPRDFAGEDWTPPFLVVGQGAKDMDVPQALQRLRAWRYQDEGAGYAPPWFLVGGYEAWAAGGHPVAKGALPTRFDVPVDPAAGEMPRAEFMSIWASRGEGRLLVDVRASEQSTPPFARHVALRSLVHELDTLPRDRELVPFCAFGRTSRIATELLRRNGFQARYLRGRLPN